MPATEPKKLMGVDLNTPIARAPDVIDRHIFDCCHAAPCPAGVTCDVENFCVRGVVPTRAIHAASSGDQQYRRTNYGWGTMNYWITK
jgi:hypothetical protein